MALLAKEQAGDHEPAHLSDQFLVDPEGASVHCNASAQSENTSAVTCQKNLALLPAGDSCSLVHASLLLFGCLNHAQGSWASLRCTRDPLHFRVKNITLSSCHLGHI